LKTKSRDILAEQGFRRRSEEGEEVWRSCNTDAQVVIDDPGNYDPFWRYYTNYDFVAEGDDSSSSKLLFVIENRKDDEPVVHGKEPDDDDKKWMKSIGIEVGEVKSPFGDGRCRNRTDCSNRYPSR
jgi:hypothetical protein